MLECLPMSLSCWFRVANERAFRRILKAQAGVWCLPGRACSSCSIHSGSFLERVGIEELRGVLAGIDVGKVVFDSEHIELLITMAPAITERCSVCNIGDGLYEVTVPGITKFDGMRAVWSALRDRGVRIGTVYGFGDSENDGSMLSAVDIAVAMGNALPAVRAGADYVTDPVWDDSALPPRWRPLASCRSGGAGPRGVWISQQCMACPKATRKGSVYPARA